MKIILTVLSAISFLGAANFAVASEGYNKKSDSMHKEVESKKEMFMKKKKKIMEDTNLSEAEKDEKIKMLKEKLGIEY